MPGRDWHHVSIEGCYERGPGEVTSAPNILGATRRREKSEEEAHRHFKVQHRCLSRTSSRARRAPLVPAGSALRTLEPRSVSSPGPSHATAWGQRLRSFQSFYSAAAQAVCMQEGKKTQPTE